MPGKNPEFMKKAERTAYAKTLSSQKKKAFQSKIDKISESRLSKSQRTTNQMVRNKVYPFVPMNEAKSVKKGDTIHSMASYRHIQNKKDSVMTKNQAQKRK